MFQYGAQRTVMDTLPLDALWALPRCTPVSGEGLPAVVDKPSPVAQSSCPVVAVVGAGGKTSLITALAHTVPVSGAGQGKAVCTTTTHILPPREQPLFLCNEQGLFLYASPFGSAAPVRLTSGFVGKHASEEAVRIARVLRHYLEAVPRVTLAHSFVAASGKLVGLQPETVACLSAQLADVPWFIEADGARGLPLKAPAPHEPVLPASITHCIAVVGLAALGRPLDARSVHRPERVCRLAAQSLGSPITLQTCIRVLTHAEGPFRTCPAHVRKVVFINGAEIFFETPSVFRDSLGKVFAQQKTNFSEKISYFNLIDWYYGSARDGWCLAVPPTAGIGYFHE